MKFVSSLENNFDNNLINNLSLKFDLHADIIKLLFSRGINTEEEIYKFLNPSMTDFHNPFLLKNMKEVVEKIKLYMDSDKKITIVGDYDTDGITASAILYKFFEDHNKHVDVFLPQRLLDGYGLSIETIDRIVALYNPDLIITVDCGISAYDEVEYCKEKGIDIIITDHHDIPEQVPDTLVIDAKLPNQMYPFTELCGAGVAFKLVHALSSLTEAMQYVTIASIATVADIVPLINENRAIVYFGLLNQKEYLPKGLKILLKKLKITSLTANDISFKLSPKLNAPGRMGDAKIAYNVYISNDDKILQENITKLLEMNDDRVYQTNKITEHCIQKLTGVNISSLGAIVLYDDNWEGGVLGIICSKLVEKYNRPVCLLSRNGNEYKGSVRSIPGINIYNVLSEIKNLMLRFGGHNQAGGLSVAEDKIEEFALAFNQTILKNYESEIFIPNKKFELVYAPYVDEKFLTQLDRLEPFGLNNERPSFLVDLKNSKVSRLKNYPNILQIKQNDLEIMAFNMGEYYYNLTSNCNKKALVDLNIEKYKNKTKIGGRVKSFDFEALNGMKKSDIPAANMLKQLKFIKQPRVNQLNISTLNKLNLLDCCKDLTNLPFGTIIITYNFNTYIEIVKNVKNIYNFELFDIHDKTGLNTLIFAPDINCDFSIYSNVVFFDFPLCDGYLNTINCANIYLINEPFNSQIFKSINTKRNIFAYYHNAIKNACTKQIKFTNDIEYFSILKKLNPQYNMNYKQYIFVKLVLMELNLLSINNSEVILNNEKNPLTNSTIYNNVLLLNKV